jgi:acetyl-CoA carboxylase biotin carboxylase subunit
MLRVAGGEPLRLRQEEIRIQGCAIECRINAEDPANGFMPNPGTVDGLTVPGGPGVRFDTMLYPGCAISPFYDSLLGKLIVWGESRSSALSRLGRALAELEISGIKTTQPLHQALVADEAVRTASFHTTFLEHWLASQPPGLVHYEELASK